MKEKLKKTLKPEVLLNMLEDLEKVKKSLQSTNEKLFESEERYRSLIESSHDIIQSVSLDGHFKFVNKAWHDILGYTKKELPKLTVFDIIHPDSIEHCKKIFQKVITGNTVKNIEAKFITKDKRTIVVEGNASPRFRGSKIISTQGFFRDVTEKKEAEEKILVHSKILTNMLEGVYLIRVKDGIIVYTNPIFEKMFGYGPGEMLGKHVSIVNAPTEKDPKQAAREITAYINKHGMWKGEILNIKKDGTPFWCYASVSIIDHPEHGKVFVSVHIDITERKKTEKVLKESEEKLSQIVMGNSIPTFVIDKNHKLTQWNRACENVTGFPSRELIGTKNQWKPFYPKKRPVMADLIVDNQIDEVEKYYKGKYKKSELIKGAYEATDFFPQMEKEGKWLFFTAASLKNNRGEIIGAIETLQDITERKKAEEELHKRIEELEKFHQLTIGRELKMVELKKRIKELEDEIRNK